LFETNPVSGSLQQPTASIHSTDDFSKTRVKPNALPRNVWLAKWSLNRLRREAIGSKNIGSKDMGSKDMGSEPR
jgi:hypothetical protein